MYAFGNIVLTRFPFTDLSGDKRRPALIVSRTPSASLDVIVCFITSIPRLGPGMVPIGADATTGLKVPSLVRFDKIATVNASVITGKLGAVSANWLRRHREDFFDVFGFSLP